jgi:hypothetical protein
MREILTFLGRHKLPLFGSLAALIVSGVVAMWFSTFFRCDVFEDFSSDSPDGARQVHSRTTGCAAVLTTNFHTTIRLVGNGAASQDAAFFESDGSEKPVVRWNGNRHVDVTISEVATIYKADSSAGDVAITYAVPLKVLLGARESMLRLNKEASEMDAGRGPTRMSEADKKVTARVDRDTVRWLSQFDDWAVRVARIQ